MAAAATFTRRPVAASTTTHAESPSKAPSSEASARGAAIYSQSWLLNIYDW